MEFNDQHITVPAGLNYYHTQVDLRPSGNNLIVDIEASLDLLYGVATWTFTGLDPATGQLTDDPLAGFLPPNGDNHEGEGFVKFRTTPHSTLSTGTAIDNMATIVFDWNPPMDTPLVFNTIDTGAPSSQILALAAQSSEQFEVTWTGQDDADGSGLASYDIYVSEDSGPYRAWLKDTTATSATFPGTGGQTYAFYSAAKDQLGNREQKPTTPDATTTPMANNLPSAPALKSPVRQSDIDTPSPALSVNNSSDPDGDTLTYQFEIYPNKNLTPPAVTSAAAVPEGAITTSWTCAVTLAGERWYSWRVRAFDGTAYSNWTDGATFFITKQNAPPETPVAEVPALPEWGVVILAFMICGLVVSFKDRRRHLRREK
jgi:hypothetical protein